MSQKILILSGRKSAGKNTICNYLHGLIMKGTGVIDKFDISNAGELIVNPEKGEGLDITRLDDKFANWASQNIWPNIKHYSYAESLKMFCINVFGLEYNQCWGTDAEKNSLTKYKWSDVAFTLPPRVVGRLKKEDRFDQQMTAREFMQHIGTDICRKIHPDCWAEATLRKVVSENVPLAIITDCRFPNEADVAKDFDAKVVRLLRNPYNDDHYSETALDDYPLENYDAVVDNENMDINESCNAVMEHLVKWGWFNGSN